MVEHCRDDILIYDDVIHRMPSQALRRVIEDEEFADTFREAAAYELGWRDSAAQDDDRRWRHGECDCDRCDRHLHQRGDRRRSDSGGDNV